MLSVARCSCMCCTSSRITRTEAAANCFDRMIVWTWNLLRVHVVALGSVTVQTSPLFYKVHVVPEQPVRRRIVRVSDTSAIPA